MSKSQLFIKYNYLVNFDHKYLIIKKQFFYFFRPAYHNRLYIFLINIKSKICYNKKEKITL